MTIAETEIKHAQTLHKTSTDTINFTKLLIVMIHKSNTMLAY